MKIRKKGTIAITTAVVLAIFCAAVVIPQLDESSAFANTTVTSDHHHHRHHNEVPAEATTALGEATTSAKSFVDDVRVNGINVISPDTVELTLAQFKDNDTDDGQNLDNITIVATAMSFEDGGNQAVNLIGDTTLNGGWSGTQSVDVKLVGNGTIDDATLITAEVMSETR